MIESRVYDAAEDYARMVVGRDPIKGVVVSISSKPIRDFWNRLKDPSEPTKVVKKWGSLSFFNIPPGSFPILQDVTFNALGDGLFIGEMLNLSFLRAEDLGKGVEITYPGLIAEAVVESFMKGATENINQLYGQYIKPSWKEVILSSKTRVA